MVSRYFADIQLAQCERQCVAHNARRNAPKINNSKKKCGKELRSSNLLEKKPTLFVLPIGMVLELMCPTFCVE